METLWGVTLPPPPPQELQTARKLSWLSLFSRQHTELALAMTNSHPSTLSEVGSIFISANLLTKFYTFSHPGRIDEWKIYLYIRVHKQSISKEIIPTEHGCSGQETYTKLGMTKGRVMKWRFISES